MVVLDKYHYFEFHYMHASEVLPYLFIDGVVHWNVPLEEAFIWDFINTFELKDNDIIAVEVGTPQGDGIGLPELQIIWGVVKSAFAVIGVLVTCFDFWQHIRKWIENTKNKGSAPTPHSYFDFILRKKCWNHFELSKVLSDETFSSQNAKKLLIGLKYKWNNQKQMYCISDDANQEISDILEKLD